MRIYMSDMKFADFYGVQTGTAIANKVSPGLNLGTFVTWMDGEGEPGERRIQPGAHMVFIAKDRETIKRGFRRYRDVRLSAPKGAEFYDVVHGYYLGSLLKTIGRSFQKTGATVVGDRNRVLTRSELRSHIDSWKMQDRGFYVILATNTDYSQNNNFFCVQHLTPRQSMTLDELRGYF